MSYFVEGTTCDMGRVEKEFEGENALRDACLKAQNIEEDGGSATVTDGDGNVVDHWEGYRVAIVPMGPTTAPALHSRRLTKTVAARNISVTKLRRAPCREVNQQTLRDKPSTC